MEENINLKEIIKNLKNKILNRAKRLSGCIDYYSKFVESIDDINLVESFEEQLPQNLRIIICNSKGNVYNSVLSIKVQRDESIQIVKNFFYNIDDEISEKINNIIEGKDNRFKLNYDSK